uniref:folate gamma-glutamyl hydrolase n=1 Tax=Periophthalmus magnuspinnatus TaxID=409849 RepID=A0A3B4AA36_9GOBI
MGPAYLRDLLQPYTPPRALRSADQLLLAVPKARLKTRGDRAFSVAAPKLWNSLPLSIECLGTCTVIVFYALLYNVIIPHCFKHFSENWTYLRLMCAGLMAQDVRSQEANEISYIAASYVKTLESAGARVLPIMIDHTEEEYKEIFNMINGFFLPGGAANIFDSGYATAAKIFYDLAIEANKKGDYFPIWGTCLGFEQLAVITARKNVLVRTNTTAVSLPLDFTTGMKMDFSPEMMSALATEPMTINAHKWSVITTVENAHLYDKLPQPAPQILQYLLCFVAYDYPIYGVQWHPEKNPYEWTRDFYVHTPNSIKMTFYFADFFVNEARKSKHTYENEKMIRDLLIYRYHPNYTGETTSVFEQKYYFYGRDQDKITDPVKVTDPDIIGSVFEVNAGAVHVLAHVNVVVLITAVLLCL